MQLNPEQQRAVEHSEGPLLIIAGAGSGKTRVLTERLARILEEGLARPENILLVTFTNKAASEVKNRVLERLAKSEKVRVHNIPWMGTFHSIAVRILRKESNRIGINNQFTIYDADDQRSLVRQIMKRRNISTKNFNPRAILGAISNAKNKLISAKHFEQSAEGYFQEVVAEVYKDYQKALAENIAMDFDDILVNCVRLFEEDENARTYYQQLFRYIMVDEYQDTNHVQYKLIRLLTQPQNNIAVVGDDDQSIYGWRGASIRNILEFEKDYPDVEVIKLERNYRSTQKILTASNAIVAGMSKRRDKKLWTDKDEGNNIVVYEALDEKDEANWLAESVDSLIEDDHNAEEIVVLYRVNAQSRNIEEAFLQAGISYKIVGNVRFYERKEVKDMLAYLRIIYNPKDTLSLLRIINVPSRKIGAKTIAGIIQSAEEIGMSPLRYLVEQKQNLKGSVAHFTDIYENILDRSHEGNIMELIDYVAKHTGYISMLNDGTEEGKQRIENIQELISVASKYKDLSPQASLQAFLEEVALVENSSTSSEEIESAKRVTLMTVHSAKGLEFGNVFIAGMEEGMFPHSRSFNSPNELDEERRLAYVAITRAKDQVFMTYTMNRTVFGSRQSSTPSRFLQDIDNEIIDFHTSSYSGGYSSRYGEDSDSGYNSYSSPKSTPPNTLPEFNAQKGDKVNHQHFGKGQILDIDEDIVTVEFDRAGIKELSTEFASLVKV